VASQLPGKAVKSAKSFLIVNRYGLGSGYQAIESLDMAFALASFGQQVSLAYLDEGVFQLCQPEASATASPLVRHLKPRLKLLAAYGIKQIYVEQTSLVKRGLTSEDLVLAVQLVTSDQLRQIFAEQDQVLSL
jgi:tRNA 2-thiouridine synthesizing protein C